MKQKQSVLVFGLAAGLVLAEAALAQSGLAVDWEWKASHRCNGTSPALVVSGIPEGTKTLAVQMNDLDFQNKDHGGGSVPHSGGADAAVPEGALTANYLGPCPNNFGSFGHDYKITVRALASDGGELAVASKTKTFSSSTAK